MQPDFDLAAWATLLCDSAAVRQSLTQPHCPQTAVQEAQHGTYLAAAQRKAAGHAAALQQMPVAAQNTSPPTRQTSLMGQLRLGQAVDKHSKTITTVCDETTCEAVSTPKASRHAAYQHPDSKQDYMLDSEHTFSSSGRFLVNQGWDLMPAMEILLAGLPTKILLIMSKHSREMCRFVGKLYFTPMILCTITCHAVSLLTAHNEFWFCFLLAEHAAW